jgi:hypothetical protein
MENVLIIINVMIRNSFLYVNVLCVVRVTFQKIEIHTAEKTQTFKNSDKRLIRQDMLWGKIKWVRISLTVKLLKNPLILCWHKIV